MRTLAWTLALLLTLSSTGEAAKIYKGKGGVRGRSGPAPSGTSSGPDNTTPSAPVTPACTHYAASASGSPAGVAGNPGTSAAPFRPSDFWAVSNLPGKVLCLKNGRYTGTAYQIMPPSSVDGTSASPIWIRAENDGQVVLDGQFSVLGGTTANPNSPIDLSGNQWIIISGINAVKGLREVVRIGESSHNVKILRGVFADVSMAGNSAVCAVTGSIDVTFEDVACLGVGRKIISPTQNSITGFTCRRCFGIFEGSTSNGPANATLDYNGTEYLFENLVVNWDESQMPSTYTPHDAWPPVPVGGTITGGATAGSGGKGIAVAERQDGFAGLSTNSDIKGSLGYLRASDLMSKDHVCAATNQQAGTGDGMSNFRWKDVACVVDPGNPKFGTTTVRAMRLQNMSNGGVGLTADRITTIGNLVADNQWTVTNHTNFSDKTAMNAGSEGPFSLTTTRARLCFRYVDGVYKDGSDGQPAQKLWPWPMNQRILDFTNSADWANYPVSNTTLCPTCTGTVRANRTPIDVTAQVEEVLGTIPAHCRN